MEVAVDGDDHLRLLWPERRPICRSVLDCPVSNRDAKRYWKRSENAETNYQSDGWSLENQDSSNGIPIITNKSLSELSRKFEQILLGRPSPLFACHAYARGKSRGGKNEAGKNDHTRI